MTAVKRLQHGVLHHGCVIGSVVDAPTMYDEFHVRQSDTVSVPQSVVAIVDPLAVDVSPVGTVHVADEQANANLHEFCMQPRDL